ncbi:MAG: DUF434 domain-containing protein [Desulfarculaceae bacterium]|jgi:hypothetical protein
MALGGLFAEAFLILLNAMLGQDLPDRERNLKSAQTKPLLEAARDARYLLGRGYSREVVLKLSGDRYGLDRDQRHLIRRGVFAPDEAQARRSRLLGLEQARGKEVAVDGHNVLITLETALSGGRLVRGDDGWVRDISSIGRNHRPGGLTWEAARLMLDALAGAGIAGVRVWLDAPLPKSGELAARLRNLMQELAMPGQAQAVPVPEQELFKAQGPVATSDTAIIDRVALPLDLAGAVIAKLKPAPVLESLK